MTESKQELGPDGLPKGAIDYSTITDDETLNDNSPERKLAVNKKKAYELRFGFSYNEDNNFLPISLYRRELRKAEDILTEKYGYVEAGVVGHEDKVCGFEVIVGGRRFAIPRDGFYRSAGIIYQVTATNGVVSVLDQTQWPSSIRAAMIGGSGMKMPEADIILNPRVLNKLRDIDEGGDITGDLRDMAIVYGLGDKCDEIPIKSVLRAMTLQRARMDFELGDNQIKKLLELIGVEIIDIDPRISLDPDAPDNARTEIDALMDAIAIADKKGKLPKTR